MKKVPLMSFLLQLIAKEANCEPDEICDFELQLCDTQPSAVAGAIKEFIFSGQLDNLCMPFCSLKVCLNIPFTYSYHVSVLAITSHNFSWFNVGFLLARQVLPLITNISPSRFVLSQHVKKSKWFE